MDVLLAVAVTLAMCCWPGRMPVPFSLARGPTRRAHGNTVSDDRPFVSDAPRGRGRGLVTILPGLLRRGRSGLRGAGRSRPGAVGPLDVATTMDLLALLTESGRGVFDGLERVGAYSRKPVQADLATVTAAHAWGLTPREAWALVGPAWQRAATALTLASTAGVPPSRILARAAVDLRTSTGARLDEAVARLGVRLVLPLGLAFLPAFLLLTVVPLVVSLATQLLG